MARSSRDLRAALRVRPGHARRPREADPAAPHGHTKARAEAELGKGVERLTDLQDRVWAEGRQKILVVLQGIDAAARTGPSAT
jgi:polyphosphate kinase 2 (PPK2 family)